MHGQEIIAKWKGRADNYPDELVVAMVRQYAQIDHFWRCQMWLSRGQNLMMLYDQFGQIEYRLLHVYLPCPASITRASNGSIRLFPDWRSHRMIWQKVYAAFTRCRR